MNKFNFRKWVHRNRFTQIFGGINRKRVVESLHYPNQMFRQIDKFKIQKVRRAHIGWRNLIWGRLMALKLRLKYGRKKFKSNFRR